MLLICACLMRTCHTICSVACPPGCPIGRPCCEQHKLRQRVELWSQQFGAQVGTSLAKRCLVQRQGCGSTTNTELAVLTLVPPAHLFWPRYIPTHKIEWPRSQGMCLTQLVWRTLPCETGDTSHVPQMATPGAQLWLDSKVRSKNSTWWCAQRQHLLGMISLVRVSPSANWYLTIDADTLIFPSLMLRLLNLLEQQLKPDEDLYAGHLHLPLLHRSDPLADNMSGAFVATGGGAIMRGFTLRKLDNNMQLTRFSQQQQHGELRWAALDWVLGMAFREAGVQPRGHAAFQQHAADSCQPPQHVSCHGVHPDRAPLLKRLAASPMNLSENSERRWARPCEIGSFPRDWRVSSCSDFDAAAAARTRTEGTSEIRVTSDKFFNLGAGKTGSSSLAMMVSYLQCSACCHFRCPTRWDKEAAAHNSSGVLQSHQCFGDNGEYADFRWLERSYPRARFLLSVRSPQLWSKALSRHIRRARLQAKCSEVGTSESCAAVPYSGNDPESLQKRLQHILYHQKAVLSYFDKSTERRSRFMMLNMTRDFSSSSAAWVGLLWLLRPDPREFPAERLVTSLNRVPASFREHMEGHEIRHLPLPRTGLTSGTSVTLKGSCYSEYYGQGAG